MPTYRFEYVVQLPEDQEMSASQAHGLSGSIVAFISMVIEKEYSDYDVTAEEPFEQVGEHGKLHLGVA
jgi:hypothetical protein